MVKNDGGKNTIGLRWVSIHQIACWGWCKNKIMSETLLIICLIFLFKVARSSKNMADIKSHT